MQNKKMKKKKCEVCGRLIEDRKTFCGNCAYERIKARIIKREKRLYNEDEDFRKKKLDKSKRQYEEKQDDKKKDSSDT